MCKESRKPAISAAKSLKLETESTDASSPSIQRLIDQCHGYPRPGTPTPIGLGMRTASCFSSNGNQRCSRLTWAAYASLPACERATRCRDGTFDCPSRLAERHAPEDPPIAETDQRQDCVQAPNRSLGSQSFDARRDFPLTTSSNVARSGPASASTSRFVRLDRTSPK